MSLQGERPTSASTFKSGHVVLGQVAAVGTAAALRREGAGPTMAGDCGYCSSGPCVPTGSLSTFYQTDVPGKNAKLSLTVTIPGTSDSFRNPFPVIFFFNGFQARAGFYQAYAERMASWGFLVVQYTLPLFWIIPDANEVQYMDGLLDWLAQENADSQSALHGMADMDRIATAGHSRGAKLACLQFARRQTAFKTAYLVDPVDNSKYAPSGPEYPSAVEALKNVSKPIGITGAGTVGRCNPPDANFQKFYSAAAGGSWLTVVTGSGHTEFCDGGFILNKIFCLLCGASGRNSFQETLRLTAPPLLAWMDKHLRAEDAHTEQRVNDTLQFISAIEHAGAISFSIKPGVTRGTDEQPIVPTPELAGAHMHGVGSRSSEPRVHDISHDRRDLAACMLQHE